MTILQEHHLTFKLNGNYHQIARQFATQQDISEKAKKVYLNTLAVCTVKTFIEELSFETILEKSFSWDPIVRCFEDVADLVVSELGRVECLFVIGEEDSVTLPKKVRQGRIAYIVVRFQEVLNEAQLLGFYPCPDQQVNSETIKVSELEPIEALIDYLFSLELENNNILLDREKKSISNWSITKWFQKGIDELAAQIGWLFADYQLSMEGTRSIDPKDIDKEVFKQKYLKLPLTIAGQNYELRIFPTNIDNNEWRFELCNAESGGQIPAGFKLKLLDENGEDFEDNEVVATGGNSTLFIEIEFEPGEGVFWEIQPHPDDYHPEVMYF
jgi:hypothetical protein